MWCGVPFGCTAPSSSLPNPNLSSFLPPIPHHPAPQIYFLALLLHRDRRDDAACREKYGRDWDKFCGLVKYRMFPLIY